MQVQVTQNQANSKVQHAIADLTQSVSLLLLASTRVQELDAFALNITKRHLPAMHGISNPGHPAS